MRKNILALAFALALTACASEPPAPPPAPLHFGEGAKIYLNTRDFRIVDRTNLDPRYRPSIDTFFKPTLSEALNEFAQGRFAASGQSGHATFSVRRASLTEESLPLKDDFESWFTRQQSKRYIAEVEVEVQAQAADGALSLAKASARQVATLPEDPSPTERRDTYRAMLKALMQDIDTQLSRAVHDHMGNALTSPSVRGEDEPPQIQ